MLHKSHLLKIIEIPIFSKKIKKFAKKIQKKKRFFFLIQEGKIQDIRVLCDALWVGFLSFFFLSSVLFLFFFLINCWSSVVASVVLPQLCNHHCPFFFDNFARKQSCTVQIRISCYVVVYC